MNRSAVREFQAPGISVPRGELLVPTEVGDPVRGVLPCPAGPLIAGSLLRKGWRCVLVAVPRLDDPGADARDAVVFLVTCPQRDGSTAALAAAASPDDRLATVAASAAVEEWAAVVGTRRLLAAGSPWCSGALRALDAARSTVSADAGASHTRGRDTGAGHTETSDTAAGDTETSHTVAGDTETSNARPGHTETSDTAAGDTGARNSGGSSTRGTGTDHADRGCAVHIYGDLAAPPEAAQDLAELGAARIASLAGIPPGDIVIFPAHGVAPDVRAEAVQQGITVVDATCPLVASAQEQAGRLTERGDDLVLIGHAAYAAAAGIIGHAPGRAAVVESVAGAATLQVTDARRVSYLLQPGIPVESAAAVAMALRSRFPSARGPHPDGFCYAPSDRVQTVRAVAADSELMLVLGDADSADARHLCGLARGCGTRTQVIAAVADLTPAMLGGVSTIGMAESTSARTALAGQMTAALSGLGPLSVVRRQVSSEISGERASGPTAI